MLVRRKLIEKKVAELLKRSGKASIPVDVKAIAEKEGVIVVSDPESTDEISGFFLIDEGQPIIGVNGNHAETRQRFTIAHELGHFLLHQQTEGVPHVDRSLVVRFRNSQSSSGEYVEEMEANLFAAELLMPSSELAKTLQHLNFFDMDGNDEKIKELAAKYRVSEQAMLIRLTNLGFVHL